jgi:uncharacterized protein (DUF952 family)/predicted GNAT superfamily acetyltransferase
VTLLHIVEPRSWSGRVDPGPEGFVHLSRPDQVHIPAQLLYADRPSLALLIVDESSLDAPIRVEGGFPHLYGPLTADAVRDVVPYDRRFAWVPTDPEAEPAASLLAADEAELVDLYGTSGLQPRDELRGPSGGFLVGWEDGAPVACAGFRRHDDRRAEIRRMYVVPDARSRGVGRALLGAVEAAARRRGYPTVVLDTGARQPEAEALYRSAGYAEVAPYRDSPHSAFWGEKHLT